MQLTKRDLIVAMLAASVTLAGVSFAQAGKVKSEK